MRELPPKSKKLSDMLILLRFNILLQIKAIYFLFFLGSMYSLEICSKSWGGGSDLTSTLPLRSMGIASASQIRWAPCIQAILRNTLRKLRF